MIVRVDMAAGDVRRGERFGEDPPGGAGLNPHLLDVALLQGIMNENFSHGFPALLRGGIGPALVLDTLPVDGFHNAKVRGAKQLGTSTGGNAIRDQAGGPDCWIKTNLQDGKLATLISLLKSPLQSVEHAITGVEKQGHIILQIQCRALHIFSGPPGLAARVRQIDVGQTLGLYALPAEKAPLCDAGEVVDVGEVVKG